MDSPLIFVADFEFNKIREIQPVLEAIKFSKRPCFLIAKHFSDDVMSTMAYNYQK